MTGDQHFAIVVGIFALLVLCTESIRDSFQAASLRRPARAAFEAISATGLFFAAATLCGVYK